MSAAELRKAAETLRGLAGLGTIPGPWVVAMDDGPVFRVRPDSADWADAASTEYVEEARYIATLHPGVGFALADWLDQCADRLDKGHHTGSRHSHRIARLINGGAS